MSESHGTVLQLKRHEDYEKVAAFVKQQVRERSLELLGEDLSEEDDYVGLQMKEDEDRIIWHDYGHHGTHLDFDPIAESVIKEFPDVEMERQDWWGQEVWNYVIADGKWLEYKLWKFYAYTGGKSDELQLEYKEPKDGRTEEEKREERDKMCKEMAERLSQSNPGVEIAVYAYDWYMIYTTVDDFYRAKEGCAAKEWVDHGLVGIMPYFDVLEWVESIGQVLLHPMEFAAEVIKRAREGEDYCPAIAAEMILNGDTAKYFSLIEPADKKWLMKQVEEREDVCAIYCLLHGMHHKYKYWTETFVDEDTNMEVELLRYEDVEGSTFEKNKGEEERLIQMVMEKKDRLTIEQLTKLCSEIDDNQELLLERINKGDEEAAVFINDPATLQELCDKGSKYAAFELYRKCMWGDEENGIFINKREAKHYFDLAGEIPQQYEEEWDDVDDPGEEYPEEFCYTLTGDAQTLGAVETLINDLCQQYGTPGNELGLYVPQQILMKLLVGSDSIYYRGNVISMERQASDRLVITTEADKGEPLLYALRECFENLEIEKI